MTATSLHLAHLETSGLIRLAQAEPEPEYIFRHALVQDAAYESMLFSDRRQLHRQVGETLAQLYPGRLEELASVLAYHFALAEDATQALKYYTLAGDFAARSHATAEAIEHYTHALEITRRSPDTIGSSQLASLYTKLGRTHEISGDYDQALAVYTEMEALAQERKDRRLRLAALMARATVYAAPTGKYDMALIDELLQQALTLAAELQDHEAEARIYWQKMLMHVLGDVERGLTAGEAALKIARQYHLRELEAYALNDLIRAYLFVGQPEQARNAGEMAQAIWRELDNKPMLADCLNSTALLLFGAGDYPQAMAYAQQARELSQRINNLWNQSYSLLTQGPIYLETGQFSQAIETMKTCIDLGTQAGFMIPHVEIASYLGYTFGILLGDLKQGFEWINHALAHSATMLTGVTPGPIVMGAYLHIVQGDLDQTAALLQKHQPFDIFGTGIGGAFIELVAGELALATQDYPQAITAVTPMQHWARMYNADLLHIKGQAVLAQGQIDQAHAILTEARTEAEQIGSKRSLWFILATLAQLEDQRSNPAEAANLRQQARQIIDYIAEHIHQPDLRTSFLNQPGVRAILDTTTGTTNT